MLYPHEPRIRPRAHGRQRNDKTDDARNGEQQRDAAVHTRAEPPAQQVYAFAGGHERDKKYIARSARS